MTRVLVLLAVIAAPACYAPRPQPGSPCDDAPCPSGLVCSPVTRLCEEPGGGGAGPDGGGGADASVDSGGDAPELRCFGTGLVKLCLDAAPRQPLLLQGGSIDTDTSPACAAYDGTGLCVLAGTDISLTDTLRATGSRPLVLVSAGQIAILGTLDAASRRTGASMTRGAGAATAFTCTGAGTPLLKGGGPGGSFGGRGGAGGIGDGGSAASAPAVGSVTALRGGCPGLAGVGTSPGAAGTGGGAVYLIARTGIGILGSINASGAGGAGAAADGGGGGGGSGGMIGLDAPSIDLAGPVFANGGGGGEGGGQAAGLDGANPVSPATPALGGAGGAPNGGNGGNGSAGTLLTGGRGGDNTANAGGGGGGGGAGVIVVFGALRGAGDLSPPPR